MAVNQSPLGPLVLEASVLPRNRNIIQEDSGIRRATSNHLLTDEVDPTT
jgi:hypothetical protein